MNFGVVRAEFGKHADAFRSGGYIALDYSVSEPYPIGEGRDAFVAAYKKYNPSSTSNVVIGQQVGQITRFCEDVWNLLRSVYGEHQREHDWLQKMSIYWVIRGCLLKA